MNHQLWVSVFKHTFQPQLEAIGEALEKRVMPGFDKIEDEAKAVSEEHWETLMSAPATGYEDPADYAAQAVEAGGSYYMMLEGIRQGMINLFAAALYHTFEQQTMYLLRRWLLDVADRNNPKMFKQDRFRETLKDRGVDLEAFRSWKKVKELNLVANTVKHGEGRSAQNLYQVRPDLFFHSTLNDEVHSHWSEPSVFLPLVGEDLYVSISDLQQYRDSLIDFWEELGEALERV